MRPLWIGAAIAACLTLAVTSAPRPRAGETASLEGFVVVSTSQASRAEAAGGSPATVPDAVKQVLGDGWTTERRGDNRYVIVPGSRNARESMGGITAAGAPSVPIGTAWERAHQLSRTEGVAYAEPRVSIAGNHGEEDPSPLFCPPCLVEPDRRSTCHDPQPGALRDPEWSLDGAHGANVLGAWKAFEQFRTAPGAGAVVAQPDTGYRMHPEIFPRQPSATGGVYPELGWNFITDTGWDNTKPESGPFDLLLQGFLRNPGHGTKTSSVIVSPRGSQFTPEAPRWVSGVAPGAVLIPLRVAEGVMLFPGDLGQLRVDVSRLADAVRNAAGPNRDKVKRRADVISISMGGLPASRDLADAVQYAEEQGVIVVAAAGNEVPDRRVVFPAAFTPVVAVAASNYANEPWPCSSHGSKVSTTAPGADVWTAGSRPGQTCVQASEGTSFATATTAGIAALWISYPEPAHQAAIAALRERHALPQAFREVLQAGYRPVPWSKGGFGPGIIDAAAVIAAPLNAVAASREAFAAAAWCRDVPASAFAAAEALFRDAPDGQQRLKDLFREDLAICASASLVDELMFWYGVDDEATAALNRISGAKTPGASDYADARTRLLTLNVSTSLRRALTGSAR